MASPSSAPPAIRVCEYWEVTWKHLQAEDRLDSLLTTTILSYFRMPEESEVLRSGLNLLLPQNIPSNAFDSLADGPEEQTICFPGSVTQDSGKKPEGIHLGSGIHFHITLLLCLFPQIYFFLKHFFRILHIASTLKTTPSILITKRNKMFCADACTGEPFFS